jgi:hypothetical protein
MKVFLTDGKKVNIYSLPQKIEDSFFITYKADSGLEDSIIITANEEKWMIISNPETNFYLDDILVENALLMYHIICIKKEYLEKDILFYIYLTIYCTNYTCFISLLL